MPTSKDKPKDGKQHQYLSMEDAIINCLDDMLRARFASRRKKPKGETLIEGQREPHGEQKPVPSSLPSVFPGQRNWYELKELPFDQLTYEEMDRLTEQPTPEETAVYNQWKGGKESGDPGKSNIRVRDG